MNDSDLIRRSVFEPEYFESVYQRHVDAIFRYVALRVGASHAEDVVAETFTIAFDRRESFAATASDARPWLYGIAANCLARHREAEARWMKHSAAMSVGAEPATADAPEERLDAQRMRPELFGALLELAPGEREVLLLYAVGGLSHGEIAAALGIREGAAKTRLSRARARLGRSLVRAGGGDDA